MSEKGNCQFAVFAKSTFSEFQKGNFRSSKRISSYKDGFWRVSKGQILSFLYFKRAFLGFKMALFKFGKRTEM
jgi:hypothetical protein